jgi:hypothetical protein
MRASITAMVLIALLGAGCARPVHHGLVEGQFSLPGRPAADLQRAGLNFSTGKHGNGHGQTARVNPDGTYSLSLPVGSYSVIGALAGGSGASTAETCQETITVVITANGTTHADFVCHASPAS